MFTVWDCESPSSGEKKRIVRVSEVDDHRHAHVYQRIVWQGEARNKMEALEAAATLEQEERAARADVLQRRVAAQRAARRLRAARVVIRRIEGQGIMIEKL